MNSYEALKVQGLRAEANPYPIPEMNAQGKLVCRFQHINWDKPYQPRLEWVEVPVGTFPRYMDEPGRYPRPVACEERRAGTETPRFRRNILASPEALKKKKHPILSQVKVTDSLHLQALEYNKVQDRLKARAEQMRKEEAVESVAGRFIFAMLATRLFASLTDRIDSEGRPIPRQTSRFFLRLLCLFYALGSSYEVWVYSQQHTIMDAITAIIFSPFQTLCNIITAPFSRVMYATSSAISSFMLFIVLPCALLCALCCVGYYAGRYMLFGIPKHDPIARIVIAWTSKQWRSSKRGVMAELYKFHARRRIFAFLLFPIGYGYAELAFGHTWITWLIVCLLAYCTNYDWLSIAERICSTASDPEATAAFEALLDANNSRLRDAAKPRDPNLRYWSSINPFDTDMYPRDPPKSDSESTTTPDNKNKTKTTLSTTNSTPSHLINPNWQNQSPAYKKQFSNKLYQPRPLSGTLSNTAKKTGWGSPHHVRVGPKPTPRVPGQWYNIDGPSSIKHDHFPQPYHEPPVNRWSS